MEQFEAQPVFLRKRGSIANCSGAAIQSPLTKRIRVTPPAG
jgi:hypothetical protein